MPSVLPPLCRRRRHCEEVALYTNWQEVRIQDQMQQGSSGGAGAHKGGLTVLLLDDLADTCQVGGEGR